MNVKRVSVALSLGLGLTLALLGLSVLTGRAAPGSPVLDPARNTHAAPPTTTVSITYDEPISAATVTSRTFAVHGMQGGLVTATHSVNGGAITADPVHPFHPGELVQVSATTGTLNLLGEAPITPTVWQFRVAAQGGAGRFGSAAHDTFGGGNSRAVALGDLDGDGDLDAVTANDDEPQSVFLNDGSGDFTSHTTFGSGDSHELALGDVDGDGDLDAVVANGSNQAQEAWFNDGGGSFPISATFGGGRTQAVALGDVDGDGDLDAVLASNSGDPQEVWFNDGGTFPISATFGAGNSRSVEV